MAHANDMTLLLNKIERRLKIKMLEPHLPKHLQKDAWCDIIQEDTLPTFSRYYPNRLKMVINEETCDKKYDKKSSEVWYYIKDEVLQGCRLLGIKDIDWTDHSQFNSSLGRGVVMNYWPGASICPVETLNSVVGLQFNADLASLYNRGIYIDFQYPNRFCLKGIGNMNYDLDRFVVVLLVQHHSLSTISPTMMETFENLATADVANYLLEIKYVDGLDTAFVSLDLKLDDLREEAGKRDAIIELIKESYVSTSNPEIPYIWTV